MIRFCPIPCVLAALLVSLGTPAQDPVAPPEPFGAIAPHLDPDTALAAAVAHIEAGETERGIAMLWTLRRRAAELPDAAKREALAERIGAALEGADPQAKTHASAMETCAKRVVGIARAYRQKRWVELATRQLLAAEAFDLGACEAERRSIERDGGGAVEASATPTAVEVPELLRLANRRWATDTWSVADDLRNEAERKDPRTRPIPGLRCKNADDSLTEVWCTKTEHADNEIVVEYRPEMDGVHYKAGVAFGEDGKEFLVEVRYDEGSCNLDISHLVGNVWTRLISAVLPHDRPLPAWQRLVVRLRGTRVWAKLNDHAPLETALSKLPRGLVALSVATSEEKTTPVGFRLLTVGPLPEGAAAAADAGGADDPDATRLARIEEFVAEARRKLKFSLPEPASRDLWDALELARELAAAEKRVEWIGKIEELLAAEDPVYRKRVRASELVAEELLELASAYADRPRLAVLLVRRAAEWDPAGTREALAAAEAAAGR